ncbi:aminoglycoside phosphotransferase family protein [Chloroflexi bacterium TSY]|nr:aminoglycoside phosphotransferase family protein [Chloroflexi bacterium TSY]
MDVESQIRTIDQETLAPIVRKVLKVESIEVTQWQHQPLQGGTVSLVYLFNGECRTHSLDSFPDNQTTTIPWSVVLKIQRQWERGGDPECWEREMMLYQSELFNTLPDTLTVPCCFDIIQKDQNEIWYWMEAVTGKTDTRMSLEDYCLAARHLAHFQGRFLVGQSLPPYSWFSTRRWIANTVSNWGTGAVPWLQRYRQLSQPERIFSPDIIEETIQLWQTRDALLDIVDSLPRTVCHRDYNAGNLFVRRDENIGEQTSVIDWDCTGIGAIGEDIADMVGEALIFYDFDLGQAEELKESVLSHYYTGLCEAGWQGDRQLLRLSYAVHSPLQWCFRVVCRAQNTDNQALLKRYAQVLRFMLNQAREVPLLAT